MTDIVAGAIITGATTTIGLVITGLFNYFQNRKIKETVEVKNQEIKQVVETYHKEVNGKMSELLVTTKALGAAEAKAGAAQLVPPGPIKVEVEMKGKGPDISDIT